MAKYENGPFWNLYQDLKAGKLSRRAFIHRATALGVALPVVQFVLNATNAGAAPGSGSKALRGRAQAAAGRPAEGTEGQTRGSGGELKLLQWQAATHASLHTSTGTKDTLAASLVSEPLMSYMPDGTIIPTLVKEVPSVENGLLAADFTSVTFNLLEGVLWSDGQPFTARDVVFTWQWITNPENSSNSIQPWSLIENIEAVDDLTARVTFTTPQLAWYYPFTSSYIAVIYPEHVLGQSPDAINDFRQNPTGTGPYKVESFAENDQVIYVINENYREPNKPFFDRVNLKGGGDAASAARAVLETGDWDFAWNLQVEPQILDAMEAAGKGTLVAGLGANVERVLINFSNPDEEFEGERANWRNPHPFLTDKAVRQAMALACDRQTMSEQFYEGPPGEPPATNILTGIAALESPNNTWEYNLEQAKQILDEAGWVLDGDVRTKDGIELSVSYSTSINAVRQKNQAVNKQTWEELGIQVQLKQVDAGIFFDSAAGNEQNAQHFYSDLLMYTNGPGSPFPITYMLSWYGGPDGSNISQRANNWSQLNESRYSNPEYDALYDQLVVATDLEQAAELFIRMNDIIIQDVVVIPLVQRASEKYAISNTLRDANIAPNQWEALYWNIANWNRVS